MKKQLSFFKTPYQGILFGMAFFVLGNSPLSFGSNILRIFFCGLGWLLIAYNLSRIDTYYRPFRGAQSLFFIIYMILVFVMIVRGYMIEYPYQWISDEGMINFHFLSVFYILPYFLPLIVFIGIDKIEFRTILKLNYIFNIIFLIFFIVTIKNIYTNSQLITTDLNNENNLLESVDIAMFFNVLSFVFLCKDFISRKQFLLNSICLLLTIITVALGGRRGGLFIYILLGIFAALIYIKSYKGIRKIIFLYIIIFFSLALAGSYYLTKDNVFSFLNKRGFEDTRSGVDKALLSQMSEFELWFGKGLNGRYYYPIKADDYINGWRYASETGFYNFVLKGGYVLSFSYIIVLSVPALMGIFRSNNNFTMALGMYILLSLVELYPFGWPKFDLKFIIIWAGVLLCSKTYIRNMNNRQIKELFF